MPRQRKSTETTEMPTETTETTETAETAAKPENKVTKAVVATPVSTAELAKITSQMQGQPRDLVAKACGYYTTETLEDGTTNERVRKANMDMFIDAVMASAGHSFAPPASRPTRSNRPPTVKLTEKGAIVLGGRYANAAGFEFGPEVESRVLVTAEPGLITVRLYQPESAAPAADAEDPAADAEDPAADAEDPADDSDLGDDSGADDL